MAPYPNPMALDFLHSMTPLLALSWLGLSIFFAVLLALAGIVFWFVQGQVISDVRVQACPASHQELKAWQGWGRPCTDVRDRPQRQPEQDA